MTKYRSPPVGNNMSWIFWDFDKDFFKNPGRLECILRIGLREDGLTPLDWYTHTFDDDHGKVIGYTMLVPLSESHLSIHTYKEHDSIAFGLYSCLGVDSGIKTYNRCLAEVQPKRTLLIKHKMPVDIQHIDDLALIVNKKLT